LNLPHAEFRSRAFVLAPLADIAADAVDPVSGRSIRELLEMPGVIGRVERIGNLDLKNGCVTPDTAVTMHR
jgi:2-amino-4-hydroxy-6-hydroxymethyldihydropteridine diphosphokinase